MYVWTHCVYKEVVDADAKEKGLADIFVSEVFLPAHILT